MSFGLELNAFAYTYGSLSVVTKGTIAPGATITVAKPNHPDVTDWRVIFTPTGTRNVGEEEVRPTSNTGGNSVILTSPADASAHSYLVLGR